MLSRLVRSVAFRGLVACVLAFSAQGAAGAERGAVVFGSWLTPHFAETAKVRVSAALEVECRIVQVRLDGQVFHRLLSPTADEAAARALVTRAQSAGFGAWYLAGASAEVVAEGCRCEDDAAQTAAAPASVPEEAAVAVQAQDPPAPVPSPQAPSSSAEDPNWRLTLKTSGEQEGAINVAYINDANIQLDGNVDEVEWRSVAAYDRMLVSEPDTLADTSYATVSRFFYTDKGLYVSAVMEQPQDTLISRLSSRDQYINRDQFGVALDTSGNGLYGYWFMVNLGGSMQDGKVLPEYTMTEQWDGPWESATAQTDTGWSAEMFLPWSMMAMPPGEGERFMGFWLKRQVAHLDETWSWPALPRTGGRFISGLQQVTLPGVQPTRQIAAFPYVSGTVDQLAEDQRARAGVDFAYRPSPNLQLTATLNPDFGAVESDDVVVNLTAYETFFPEKRQFFLEGNEVFFTSPRADVNRYRGPQGSGARATPSTFTPEPTTLINTRRIGGAPRQLVNDVPDEIEVSGVERTRPTDLLGAAKLVGQAGGLRFGVLGAMEDDVVLRGTDESGADVEWEGEGRDFGVVRALYEQTGSGRRSIGYMGTMVNLPGERDPAIVHGIDAHALSPRGRLSWDGQYVYSYAPPNDRDNAAVTGHGIYNDFQFFQRRGLIHSGAVDYIDRDLSMRALGFIGRNDAIVARYGIIRYANLKRFRQIRNSLFFSGQTNVDGFANRLGIFSSHSLMLNNSSEIKGYVNYFPSRWDDLNSRGNGMFKVKGRLFTQIGFGTDTAKPFSWSGTLTADQEELGGRSFGSDFGITYKPIDRLSLDFDVRYMRRDGWLLHSGGRKFTTYSTSDVQPIVKADFFFTARHQIRLTLQWAGIDAEDLDYLEVPESEDWLVPRAEMPADGDEDFTISRLTGQFRYRWEIGPLSDLFVVYTRGSNLVREAGYDFGELFTDALREPIVDFMVVKLRYRFGS